MTKLRTEWTVDVEATETTPGSKSHHCTVCGEKTDVTEIPATGPKYDAEYYAQQCVISQVIHQQILLTKMV